MRNILPYFSKTNIKLFQHYHPKHRQKKIKKRISSSFNFKIWTETAVEVSPGQTLPPAALDSLCRRCLEEFSSEKLGSHRRTPNSPCQALGMRLQIPLCILGKSRLIPSRGVPGRAASRALNGAANALTGSNRKPIAPRSRSLASGFRNCAGFVFPFM